MPPEDRQSRRSRLGLAAFMLAAGVNHFANPQFYDAIVPKWMPGAARTTTYVSGAAELVVGALTLNRPTARLGAWTTLLVLIGVYPANVQMAIDAGRPSSTMDWLVWFRLPLQFPMFWWALRHSGRSAA